MPAHVKYLKKYYKKNIFVASGRKVPRSGGIILALRGSEEEVREIIGEDPFYQLELAEFDITHFFDLAIPPGSGRFAKRKIGW